MTPRILSGVLPVIPTPFDSQGEVDEASLRSVVEYAITQGAGGVCSPMFASEFYKLSDAEVARVTRIVVSQADGRVPVIAQCNHPSLSGVLARAEFARQIGADWIGVLVPCLFPITAADLAQFYREICRQCPLPVLAQDADYAGGVLPPSVAVELFRETPNFRAVKLEGPLNGPKFEQLRRDIGPDFMLTSGWAGLDMYDAVSRKVDGVVPGTAMIRTYVRCWDAFLGSRRQEGFRALATFMPLANLAMQNLELLHFVEKHLLKRLGVIVNDYVRPPSFTIDRGYREQITAMIDFYLEQEKQATVDRAETPS